MEQSTNTLEEYFKQHQDFWNAALNEMNDGLKDFARLPDILNVVYAKRQDAVDYYHTLLASFAAYSKEYKKQYADVYNSIKTNSNLRYSSESAIGAQVDSALRDYKYQIDIYDNHIKYMWNTIKSIDNLIYGINSRIEVEKLIQGVKF